MKRGRPPKEVKRDQQYRLRLTTEERNKLNEYSEKTGKVISEIIREAVKKFIESQ